MRFDLRQLAKKYLAMPLCTMSNSVPAATTPIMMTRWVCMPAGGIAAELEARVRAVVLQLPAAVARPARERNRIAEVVAVDHVHRQSHRHRLPQGLRADHVAAVDHDLGALLLRLRHRLRQRVGAVVAVGDDAELHEIGM